MKRRSRRRFAVEMLGRAALWAALAFCCVSYMTPAWTLSDSLLSERAALSVGSPAGQQGPASGTGDGNQTADGRHTRLQLVLTSGARLKLTSLVFHGKRAAASAPQQSLGRDLMSPALALGGEGYGGQLGLLPAGDRAQSDEAYSYKLSYANTRLQFGGAFTDVGARFSPSTSSDVSGDEMEALRQALGTRALQLNGVWQLAPGASLSTEHKSVRNDKPGDEKNGATLTDSVHTLALKLGGGSSLKASLTDHEERWDRSLGKPAQTQRTSSVEFNSQFGAGSRNSLRLALTTVERKSARDENGESTSEAHLALQPTGRLRLTADYTAKSPQQGSEQTTSVFGAALQLAGGGQLAANLKTVTPGGGARTDEASFQLNTSLGGGASKGTLAAQQTVTRTADANRMTKTNLSLGGALGSGRAAMNLSFRMEEQRDARPTGPLSRTTAVHLDRALRPGWKLAADCEQKMSGTNEAPRTDLRSVLSLVGQLGPKTQVTVGLTNENRQTGVPRTVRDLTMEHGLRFARLQTGLQVMQEGAEERMVSRWGVELPRGSLPEWASSLPSGHEFGDAGEFLCPQQSPVGLESPFAGLRLSAKQRRGGPDDGKDTFAVSHGTTLLKRYYLQVGYQQLPEGTEGDEKDRPIDVQRRVLMLGSPLRKGLVGRLWLASETSASDPGSQRSKLGLSVWGRVNERDQLEASVSRDSEQWMSSDRDRTTVSVLFARKVSEENKLHLKVGYTWGREPGAGDTSRDYRVSLAYEKPI